MEQPPKWHLPRMSIFSFFWVLRDINGFNHDVLGFVEYTGPRASDFLAQPDAAGGGLGEKKNHLPEGLCIQQSPKHHD